MPDETHAPRLTALAHGGGCGCKLAPAILRDLLAGQGSGLPFPDLLVGNETGDDAAVYRLEDGTCLVATTDFFTPIVDDPRDFGRIAAANAISDVYAMGGRPLMALAILGMPLGRLPTDAVRAILAGGASICAEAGIPVAGGHSIDAPEPIYGLAVIGTVRADEIRRNAGARPGDRIILTKALGVGIYSAAFRKDQLPPEAYDEMIASTTLLNRIGGELGRDPAVHAMTDVTGFGLLGHGLEVARGSDATLAIEADAVPLLPSAAALAQAGHVTGASARNWASYSAEVDLPPDLPAWRRQLLADPQTSGGLLVACAPDRAEALTREMVRQGYASARVVGTVEAGPPRIRVVA